jgi:hypothetical protein
MIDIIRETSGKSPGISEPGRKGVAGPSREVSQRDEGMSGAESSGREENAELEWAKLHVKEETEPQLAQRKTELHYADPVPVRKRKTAASGQLMARLKELECRVDTLEQERDLRTPPGKPVLQEEIAE